MKKSLVVIVLCAIALPAFAADRPSLALDSSGRPFVAWVEHTSSGDLGFVKAWNGTSWQRIGGALNLDPADSVTYVSLALTRADVPVVAWTEMQPERAGIELRGDVHIARWTGANWSLVTSNPMHSEYAIPEIPILRLDSRDLPLLVWSEISSSFEADNVYASRWDGSRWIVLDDGSLSTDVSSSSRAHDVAVDHSDRPVMTWSWHVMNKDFNVFVGPWNGQRGWSTLGGSLNRDEYRYAGAPTVALDGLDRPYVAFVQADKGFDLWVKHWDGAAWQNIGPSVNNRSGGARNPRLALGPDFQPVVAWIDNLGNDQLYVARWSGSSWVVFGSALNRDAKANVELFDMRLDRAGNPTVVWDEDRSDGIVTFVDRWDGSEWVSVGR